MKFSKIFPTYKIKADNIREAGEIVADFIQNASFEGANLNLLDGLRVEYDEYI